MELKGYPVQRIQLFYFLVEETEAQGGEGTSPRPGNPFVARKRPLSGTYPLTPIHWDLLLVSLCCLRTGVGRPSPGYHATPLALSLLPVCSRTLCQGESKPFGGEEGSTGISAGASRGTTPPVPFPIASPPARRGSSWSSNHRLSPQKG